MSGVNRHGQSKCTIQRYSGSDIIGSCFVYILSYLYLMSVGLAVGSHIEYHTGLVTILLVF